MIVFIGGMMRSGSTFTFNVARSLLAARGTVYHEPNPALAELLKAADGFDHLLFKAHTIDETTARLTKLGAVKTILTVRKPEDSIASLIRTFSIPLDQSIKITNDWLSDVAPMSRHSLTLNYETIDTQPAQAIAAIVGYLGLDASPQMSKNGLLSKTTNPKLKSGLTNSRCLNLASKILALAITIRKPIITAGTFRR